MNKILNFLKTQAVLVVAWILAIVSAFFVHPDSQYIKYIDWRSLGILWSLMAIMAALRINGVFEQIGSWLLGKVKRLWQLISVLIFLCFFLSMLVTNDVALITFVPFAILILEACNCEKLLIPVIVLQTIAANLGSMLTPIGNPQNLYLFGLGGFTLGSFIQIMLPYTAASFILLVLSILIIALRNKENSFQGGQTPQLTTGDSRGQTPLEQRGQTSKLSGRIPKPVKLSIFAALFITAILTVLHIVPFYILVPVVLIFMALLQPKAIAKVDYSLLLTFVGFFIFTGNIARIDFINQQLQSFVGGKELLFGVVTSQFISNVPASLLLSGFSTSIPDLIVGVNLGGLGTLIASMASLISFKLYAANKDSKSGKYLLVFTALNILYLAILLLVTLIF